jgi:FtsZ-interacting cell division protein YlmF
MMGLLDIIKKGGVIVTRPVANKENFAAGEDAAPQSESAAEEEQEQEQPEEIPDRQEIAAAILYQTPTQSQQETASFSNYQPAFVGQALANQNILVTSLKNRDEIRPILDNLLSGNPCVVSLDESDTPQRHLDFLSGFVTAINGTIKQIDPTKLNYILTPKGVGVKE